MMNVQHTSDLNKSMMWPSSGNLASQHAIVPGTTPVHFFPNGLQLNQMWMDSLAKGMAQEQVAQSKQTQQLQRHQQRQPQPQSAPSPPQEQYVEANTVPNTDVANISPIHQPNVMTNPIPSFQHQPTPVNLPATTISIVNNTFSTASPNQVHATPMIPVPNMAQPQPSLSSNVMGLQKPNKGKSGGTSRERKKQANQDEETAEQERKRKNREFAKRSREKRRNEHKHLEEQMILLQKENIRLRNIVQNKIPDQAQEILKKCCRDHPLHHAAVRQGVNDVLATSDFHLLENLIKEQQSFCMTDPMQEDNPIVYASESFYQLTGYTKEETLGRNCRFLQGKDTDRKAVALIAESIKNGKDTSVNLLNYKASGLPFWNQFFIVALRNHGGKIVNFVGVQCEIEDPNEDMVDKSFYKVIEQKKKSIRIQGPVDIGLPGGKPDPPLISEGDHAVDNSMVSLEPVPIPEESRDLQPLDANGIITMDEDNRVDWSMLANVLEDDFRSGVDDHSIMDDNNTASVADAQSLIGDTDLSESDGEKRAAEMKAYAQELELDYRTLNPRAMITRTCRSELVASLLSSHGDVTNPRFLQALDIISSIYASSDPGKPVDDTSFIDNFLNSAWVSLSRPAYDGCLGKTNRGDFMYALGKMSFNMFKPGHLKCSIQHTLNKIDYVCDMNEARNAVPWSLRRELAMTEDEETDTFGKQQKTLRSYDIEIAVTVEPGDDEIGPKKPLRAIQVVNGYMLRDPDKKNRMSVWFTGGKLAPFFPDENPMEEWEEYGSFEEWKALFDQEYTSSWSESFKNMGAKLLLGAQLPQGMQPDGSLSYSLTRPYGGHGKSFIDVLYLDEGLFITRGNNGTIHVMVRSNLLCPAQEGGNKIDGCVKSATEVNGVPDSTPKRKTSDKSKRKAADMGHAPDQANPPPDQVEPPVPSFWQEALKKDLANRDKDSIADDLSKILQEYGIQIQPNMMAKRAKLN